MGAGPAERADRRDRLALSLLVEPGDPALAAQVGEQGASAVLQRWPAAEADRVRSVAEQMLAIAPGTEQRWICPHDAEWPAGLSDLDEVDALQRRGGSPLGLWVRGGHRLDTVTDSSVAIVGARASTTYGNEVSGDLAADLVRLGTGVVSGAAYGIDAAAHRGALAGEGITVAVLACGVDVAYPRGNETLLRRIAADGLLVSELPPGSSPTRLRFLSRNRLIAALARGTVVVEAALRSGALNTANWAGSLGRTVMAVPGPVSSEVSAGAHRLIREGGAELVTCGADVAESIAPLGTHIQPWVEGPRRLVDDLAADDLRALEALEVSVATSVADVAARAHLSDAATRAALDRLRERSLAEGRDGGWQLSRSALTALRAR